MQSLDFKTSNAPGSGDDTLGNGPFGLGDERLPRRQRASSINAMMPAPPKTFFFGLFTLHTGGLLHRVTLCLSRENWLILLVILFYFGSSISLTMFNKWFFAVAPRHTDASVEAEFVLGTAVVEGVGGQAATLPPKSYGQAISKDSATAGRRGPPAVLNPSLVPSSSPPSAHHMFAGGSQGVSSLGFHFPLTVTCIHQVLVWVLLIAVEHQAAFKRVAGEIVKGPEIMKAVVPVGVLCGLDWGLSNSSLRSITLSLYELVKACTPLLVLALSAVLGLQELTCQTVGIMVLVSIGMILSVSGGDLNIFSQSDFPRFGFGCVVGAACLGATRVVLAQRVLQRTTRTQQQQHRNEQLPPTEDHPMNLESGGAAAEEGNNLKQQEPQGYNAVTVLYYAAPASAAALVLPAFISEGRAVYSWFNHATLWQMGSVGFWVSASTAIAFLLSISEFVVTRQTSALTLCIAGIGKQVLIVSLAMLLFGDTLKATNLFGFGLTLVGIFLYNRMKLLERAKQERQETDWVVGNRREEVARDF